MQRIDELKLELRKAILESEEYKEYKRLEAIIMRNPELKRNIDEFRRQNFELQNSPDVQDIFSTTNELNERYAFMRNQDSVNRYLTAEICLCRLVQDICRSVVDVVDMNLDFLQ